MPWVLRENVLLPRSYKRSKRRIGHSENRTKVSMIGHGVLFTEEILRVLEVYFITDSRLLPIKSSTKQNLLYLSFRRTCARTVRGHAPSTLTRKRIFANKQDKTALFFFRMFLKDVLGLHKGSYVVSMRKIVSLIFWYIAVSLAATHPKILRNAFLR